MWNYQLVQCFWQGLVLIPTEDAPFSDYAAADQRYLMVHIKPDMVRCEAWYVTVEMSRACADVILF